jgi:ABC-2 type transport system permease protein
MPGNEAFEMVAERGWSRGLSNLLRSGLARWFKTRMWLIQSLVWGGIVGFLLGTILFGQAAADRESALTLLAIMAGIMPAIAVVIIMQGAVVGEKKEGTAAWVLSKPATRASFILSKLLANSLGVFVCMVLVPFAVAYILLWVNDGAAFDPARFLGVMGTASVHQLYFLTLTLMLGTIFDSRGAVIGIGLTVLFMQQYLLGTLPFLRYLLPWTLAVPISDPHDSLILTLLSGYAVQSAHLITVGCVLLECALFVAIGVWRFNRQEL